MAVINRRQLSGTGVSPAHVKDFLDLLDQALDEFTNIGMDDAADATGGATTTTAGFQLRNVKGDDLALQTVVEFAVFDDSGLATPASNATLDTATAGTILSGGGSSALKVETDSTGKFTCTLTNTVDESVFLACNQTFGGPLTDCREIDQVTFSA